MPPKFDFRKAIAQSWSAEQMQQMDQEFQNRISDKETVQQTEMQQSDSDSTEINIKLFDGGDLIMIFTPYQTETLTCVREFVGEEVAGYIVGERYRAEWLITSDAMKSKVAHLLDDDVFLLKLVFLLLSTLTTIVWAMRPLS